MTISRYVLPFPVAPGKTSSDAAMIATYFKAHLDEYQQSRRRLGMTVERAYLQDTPMGPVVVAYIETEGSYADWVRGILSSDLDIDKHFVAMVADIHGFDLRHALDGPAPETLGEWVDPAVETRRKGQAFVAPLQSGKEAAARAFAHEAFVTRKTEFIESRKALGQTADVVTLNVTPKGSFIGVYIEGNDPVEANRRFAISTRPYDVWFKDQLKSLFPSSIDFSQPLSPTTTIFDHVEELVLA